MAAVALLPSPPRLRAALLCVLAAAPAAATAGVRLERAAGADTADAVATDVVAPALAGERACMRVLRAVARGQAFVAADLRRERCGRDEPVQRAHYDRDAGLARAPADLAAGAAIAPVAPTLLADLRQGDKVALIYRDGAIAISRGGVAARDSKPGAAVRVALPDGAVVTAPSSAADAVSAPALPSLPPSSRPGETP
ncbi:hypothetical protein [Lysobacter enzymogenes]|uniref:Flagella basal body P-ring formation protein FlgA C-terminal domain-containing protein n=1 Tax=Lysobacter enzymogenes TaxID=69 RepID=A0A3N2RK93_LYSEN|nr:hypothetical protein [Lysobacter enzymogenes]ROU07791.1 hypothetical protein D9T17_06180 [Lysobacter enzymogenes]